MCFNWFNKIFYKIKKKLNWCNYILTKFLIAKNFLDLYELFKVLITGADKF